MDLENILNTIQPFLVLFVALFAAFLTATWISSVIWAFRDIRARTRDIFAQILATLMVLIFFPLFPLPGLALYLILRPRETLSEVYERQLEEEALLKGIEERMACPSCNRSIEPDFVVCPSCHTRLKKPCLSCSHLLHLRWNICPYCGAAQTTAQPVILPPEEAESPLLERGTRFPVPELAGHADDGVDLLGQGEKGDESASDSQVEDDPFGDPTLESQPGNEPGVGPWTKSVLKDESSLWSLHEHPSEGDFEETPWGENDFEAEPRREDEADSDAGSETLPF